MGHNRSSENEVCRVLILAAAYTRLQKVVSLLKDMEDSRWYRNVTIEYCPCVAVFGSFVSDAGSRVRCLLRVDYFGPDASFEKPQTLLSFFDEEYPDDDDGSSFRGISVAVAGSGIRDSDAAIIGSFLATMSKRNIPIECLQPNPEFSSMEDELTAFRALSPTDREVATRQGTIGPGKMVKFIMDVAKRRIDNVLKLRIESEPLVPLDESPLEEEQTEKSVPRQMDPNKNIYACRKCRLSLFGDDDLQDPVHVPSRHTFSPRKHDVSTPVCQSLFLQNGLDWMGDMNDTEGKFACPSCVTKLGVWNWSGAQCSCGTWVVPAIQIPNSRVDVVPPNQPGLPVGTIVSPVIQQVYPGNSS